MEALGLDHIDLSSQSATPADSVSSAGIVLGRVLYAVQKRALDALAKLHISLLPTTLQAFERCGSGKGLQGPDGQNFDVTSAMNLLLMTLSRNLLSKSAA